MGKKAGAVREKKHSKARLEKTGVEALEGSGREPAAAPKEKGKVMSLFSRRSKEPGGTGPEERSHSRARPKEEKKATGRGKEVRARDTGRPRRSFFQESVKFFQTTWAELKKVHWPTRSETVVYTAVVLGSVVFVALLIWVVDSSLSWLLNLILRG